MCRKKWLSCPEDCDARVEAVSLRGSRIGFHCVGCGRKIEFPVPTVEADYRVIAGG